VAGIAALLLTGFLGTAMGLNNTATFMSSCVAFVAVSMWTDSRIARRRREAARNTAPEPGSGPRPPGQGAPRSDADVALESEAPKRDGLSS
jgi:hypothetical protein